ncbi:MAG: hypothetical protein ACFHWX_07735 [Bacteroidota bacterium]
MKSISNSYYLLYCSIFILLIACSRPPIKSYQSYVDAEEMCRILEKKRNQKTGKKVRPNRPGKKSIDNFQAYESDFSILPEYIVPSPDRSIESNSLSFQRRPYPPLLSIGGQKEIYADQNLLVTGSYSTESSHTVISGELPSTHLDTDPIEISGDPLSYPYTNNYHFPAALFGGAFLAGLGLFKRSKSISSISGWAQTNPIKSRWTIAGIHTAMIPCMALLGNELYLEGSLIPDPVLYGSMGLLGSSIALSNYKFPKRYYYNSMRALTVSTALSGSLMIMHAGNHYEIQNLNQVEISTPQATFASLSNISLEERDATALQEPKKKGLSTGAKITLTVLAIAAAVGLFLLLAGLSCNIACAGYEVVAWIVFIGGNIGNAALLIYAIKSIFGKNKKQKLRQTQPI